MYKCFDVHFDQTSGNYTLYPGYYFTFTSFTLTTRYMMIVQLYWACMHIRLLIMFKPYYNNETFAMPVLEIIIKV